MLVGIEEDDLVYYKPLSLITVVTSYHRHPTELISILYLTPRLLLFYFDRFTRSGKVIVDARTTPATQSLLTCRAEWRQTFMLKSPTARAVKMFKAG